MSNMQKSLKDRVKEFSVQIPFMENREKGEMDGLKGEIVTITDFGFLRDTEKDQDYVCFIIEEDPERFYFGGQVLTDQLSKLEDEGYKEEINAMGLPALFTEKKNRKGNRTYTTVEFYPEAPEGGK